jgi:hypothetical protein
MDKTPKDNDFIKSWYNDAQLLTKEYTIAAYPTYLIFAPNGSLVYQAAGYLPVDEFIATLEIAVDSTKNSYGLVKNYRKGIYKLTELGEIASKLKLLNDDKNANEVAKAYKRYLIKLPMDSIAQKEKVKFIQKFPELANVKDNFFELFYKYPKKGDSLAYDGYAEAMVNYLITRDEITPLLWKDSLPVDVNPNWKAITKAIDKKYTFPVAERNVLAAKLFFYFKQERWPETVDAYIEKIEKSGLDTADGLNQVSLNRQVWEIFFLHCNDSAKLLQAADWMLAIIQPALKADNIPNVVPWMDTYANLLYKAGRKEVAISWQQKAIVLIRNRFNKHWGKTIKEYEATLSKMQKGEKTW